MKKNNLTSRRVPVTAIVSGLAAAIVVAIVYAKSGNYSLFALNQTLIFSFCTMGIYIMLGLGGMMTFASVSFFGLGAYIVANLTTGRLGITVGTLPALFLAPILTALVAALIGIPLLRLKGTYFTFATIGFVQVAYCFFNNYAPLFGGYNGIAGVPSLNLFGLEIKNNRSWLLVLVVCVLLAVLIADRIRKSRLGRSLAAIRDNDTAAQTLGIDVYRTKIYAFTISAAFCAFGGGLYAMCTRFVGADCFTYQVGITYIIMAMLGGVNSALGCVFGSVLVGMLPEWLRVLEQYMQLIYGGGVIILMIFMPMGLNGLRELLYKKYKHRKKQYGEVVSNESNSAS